MHRRRILSLLGAACSCLLAGCTLETAPEVSDVTVRNESGAEQTVTVEITETNDDTTVFSRTVELETSGERSFDDPITEPGTYRIAVVVENETGDSYVWDLPSNDEAVGLEVSFRSQSIDFQLIAA